MTINLETVLKLLACVLWGLAAFGVHLLSVPAGVEAGWHSFLLGLALWCVAPIVGGFLKKHRAS